MPFNMTGLILGARNISYTRCIAGGNYKTRLHDSVIKTEFFKYILTHKNMYLSFTSALSPSPLLASC